MKIDGEKNIRFMLGCIVLGLEYLHNKDIVHQDLKPDNLLVFEDGYIKICDFGCSRDLSALGKYETKGGTPLYFAPEIILREDSEKSVDLWALGVTAYLLVTFEFPFEYEIIQDGKKYAEAVVKGEKERSWRDQKVS